MAQKTNIWENDRGFIWMLIIALVSLVSTQLTEGIIWESKFIVRGGYFLFTIIAIRSSSLVPIGKAIGYGIALTLLLFAIALIFSETQILILIYTVLATSYMIFILALVVKQIFANGIITVNKIIGGVAAYIILGHLWASLYLTLFIMYPESFQSGGEVINNSEALKQLSYFSFVTLTTIGYGDITAVSSAARILAMMEGLLGQLFPAIFIAKLVSLQIEHARK
jgi:hypothetical protein